MSGGVDSSVAAALLREAGHQVVGVTMQVWPSGGEWEERRRGGCCGLGAVRDARAVADALGIPHYVFNMRELFADKVIAYFADEYAGGRTPNPCIACNEHVKFRALLDKAERLGADFLATGHYARVGFDPAYGRHVLRRAADRRKDQSYVLYVLRPDDLRRVLFPLGDYRKEETRALARRLGLPVADKPDSQEICFVGPEGYPAVVAERRPEAMRPGPILDTSGRVLGTHRGLAAYTVGQRRGLGLSTGRPLFVLALDARRNALVVGPEEELLAGGCVAEAVRWLAVDGIDGPRRVTARVRAGGPEVGAQVWAEEGGRAVTRFDQPVRAVAPGQSVVWYEGDVVLGGGRIAAGLGADRLRAVARPAVRAASPAPDPDA
jgi:tRNA-specific 2-thiouridylase